MGKQNGLFQIRQVVVIKGKLALQGAIGDPAMLVQHGDGLAEDLIERHRGSSVCGVTPQGASTAAYHTRTPAEAPCREVTRGVPRLHTIGGARYRLPQVSTPHVQGSQREVSTSMASAKIGRSVTCRG